MSDDTKVADLPAKWRAKAKRIRGITAGSDLAADIMEGSAEDLEAALARQEAVDDDIIAAAELRGYRRRQEEEEAAQEPVAWYLPSEDGYDSCFRDHRTIISCTGNPWAGWIPLYAAPPAQVDLEQFRCAVVTWRNMGEAVHSPEQMAEANRILALIDQQAGKGGA